MMRIVAIEWQRFLLTLFHIPSRMRFSPGGGPDPLYSGAGIQGTRRDWITGNPGYLSACPLVEVDDQWERLGDP
jgi:hypothetical protein